MLGQDADASAALTDAADVVILGGGPAGAAAALTLLRYSTLRVAVIERSTYDRWRPGEALSPEATPLLHYLDADGILDAGSHLPARGTAAAWGTADLVARDFLYAGRGLGWHLDRARFDRRLVELVASRGGVVTTDARVVNDTLDNGVWRLTVEQGSPPHRTVVTARFVIDATGRHAAFARRRGARRGIDDALFGVIGVGARRDAAPDAPLTVVESCPSGWWYSARLADGRIVAALMTDADLIRRHRLRAGPAWWALLQETHHTRHRLADEPPVGPLAVCPAFSQVLQPVIGERWIAAGEAAVGFDPLSSMGIGYALTSGIHAARAAHDALTSGGVLAGEYALAVRRHYTRYRARQRGYYAMEPRWRDAPFWARRAQPEGRSAFSTAE